MTREETYAQMRKRLELNWNRREPTCARLAKEREDFLRKNHA